MKVTKRTKEEPTPVKEFSKEIPLKTEKPVELTPQIKDVGSKVTFSGSCKEFKMTHNGRTYPPEYAERLLNMTRNREYLIIGIDDLVDSPPGFEVKNDMDMGVVVSHTCFKDPYV